MRRLALLAPVLLAACLPTAQAPVENPTRYVPTDAPVPFAVSRLLPRGVTQQDVRVWDNCYAYAYNGAIYPVLIPRGTQYCL
ncbi:MAG: hypothetical protein WBA67_12140 [Jannaschia sp.]